MPRPPHAITVQAGACLTNLDVRRPEDWSRGRIARRDLIRYYDLVDLELAIHPMKLSEVEALTISLYGVVVLHPATLWGTLLRLKQSKLASTLMDRGPGYCTALYDALERYWTLPELDGETVEMRARRAGFTLK